MKWIVLQCSDVHCSVVLDSAVQMVTVVLQFEADNPFVFPENDPRILKSCDTVVSALDHVMPFCLMS